MKNNKVMVLLCSLLVFETAQANNIVSEVANAPVVSDGTTSGHATDLVINLDSALDPSIAGRTLMQGKQVRITLPKAFKNTLGYPFSLGPECAPPLSGKPCNTGVLVQGWPQHPIAPPPEKFSIEYEADSNTIVYTALQDLEPSPPLEPGLKQMHIILLGFTNPRPGNYRVRVEAETGANSELETGWANVRIIPKSKPKISVTSTGFDNPTTSNTIYQQTTVNNVAPLNFNFLLWDRNDQPFVGVDLTDLGGEGNYLLREGNRVVGHVSIDAPDGASGHMLLSLGPSVLTNPPTIGAPIETGLWTGSFMAGTSPGLYTINVKLNGGNEVNMFVEVSN